MSLKILSQVRRHDSLYIFQQIINMEVCRNNILYTIKLSFNTKNLNIKKLFQTKQTYLPQDRLINFKDHRPDIEVGRVPCGYYLLNPWFDVPVGSSAHCHHLLIADPTKLSSCTQLARKSLFQHPLYRSIHLYVIFMTALKIATIFLENVYFLCTSVCLHLLELLFQGNSVCCTTLLV